MRLLTVIAIAGLLAGAAPAAGQPAAAQPAATLTQQLVVRGVDPPATFYYNNRPIITFRATVVSRTPAERAGAALRTVDDLVERGSAGTVTARFVQGVQVISIGGSDVFGIMPLDADDLLRETQAGVTADTVRHLQQAIDEAIEMRTPARLLWSAERSGLGTLIFVLLIWILVRTYRVLVVWLTSRAEHSLQKIAAGDSELVAASRATDIMRRAVTMAAIAVGLLFSYNWLTFVLRSVPYTRPWGESLRGFLAARVLMLGLMVVHALPNLFTVVVILLAARVVVRLTNLIFYSAEQGRLAIPWVYPETAAPTRRLTATLVWVVAVVVAYPYLPGSDTDAFKGVSVFVGLMVSLGSSGVVNQMMSGLTITYSRSLRAGDYVSIGDVEGTVEAVGPLSTKVKTPRGEDVTIPNAVVVSGVTRNYSRYHASEGVFVPTSITIGYDTPWRQVHALLLLAAQRTAGIRKTPAPFVRPAALQDFYVEYTLLVSPEEPGRRASILAALHANILDVFNEFDVQITSPNYEADPDTKKTVPRSEWYAAPASRPPD